MSNLNFATLVVENAIESLEKEFTVPGTQLSRVLATKEFLKEQDIHTEENNLLVWCLSLGPMGLPKQFFYGKTVYEVFRRARK